MRFLDLIEQHDRVGFSSDGFRQLTTLIVSHVSRRRTDQSGRTELLLILTHIDTRDHVLVIEQVVRKRFRQFCLTDTSCTQEDETTDRSFGVLKPCSRSTDRITNRLNGLILTDDTLMQFFLQMQQLITLALHHLRYRNTRPASNYFGDIVFIDFLFNQGLITDRVQRVLCALDISFCGRNLTIANLRYFTIITFALCYLRLMFQGLDACFLILDSRHVPFLLVPAFI